MEDYEFYEAEFAEYLKSRGSRERSVLSVVGRVRSFLGLMGF